MFTFILIIFQLLEFFLVRNSVFIPNLSRHFLKMNYANWESHLHLNLWSFLFSLSNVCRKKKFDETKFVALPLFLWWYLIQENFCKDKGNLFYVSITFWMMLMCKKIVWILKNPLILFENSGKNEFNFSTDEMSTEMKHEQ